MDTTRFSNYTGEQLEEALAEILTEMDNRGLEDHRIAPGDFGDIYYRTLGFALVFMAGMITYNVL